MCNACINLELHNGFARQGLKWNNAIYRWIEAFGGQIDVPAGEDTPEISPTKSYFGEGLDFAVAGRKIKQTYDPILQVCTMLRTLQKFCSSKDKICSIKTKT